MEQYRESWSNYMITLRTVEGMGERGQYDIDHSYNELQQSYKNLSEEEKDLLGPLVPKYINTHDGTSGFSTAMTNVAQRGDCNVM